MTGAGPAGGMTPIWPFGILTGGRTLTVLPASVVRDISASAHAEELIQHATETITKGRTAIVIAHRLATIVNADTIIVMEKGEIVETGNHQELLQLKKGYYRKLYESQFSETPLQ